MGKLSSFISRAKLASSTVGALGRLLKIVGGGPRFVAISCVFGIVSAFCETASMAMLMPLLELLFKPSGTALPNSISVFQNFTISLPEFLHGSRSKQIGIIMGALFLVMAARVVCEFGGNYFTAQSIFRLTARMRYLVFSRLLTFGKSYFDRSTSGHVYNVVITHGNAIANCLMEMRFLFLQIFMSAAYIALLVSISWKLTLFGAVASPLYLFALRKVLRKMKGASHDLVTAIGDLSQRVSQVIMAVPLIISQGMEEEEKARFLDTSEKSTRLELSMNKRVGGMSAFQDIFLTALTFVMVLIAYLVLIRAESSSGAEYLVYFVVLRRLTPQIMSIVGSRLSLERFSGPFAAILAIFDDQDKHFVPSGKLSLESFRDRISFRAANFGYRAANPVIRDVSFDVEKGQMTAIIGPSGSGKSTLISLLQRFYDCEPGTIFIDGTDIRSFDTQSLRQRFAVVSQEVHLFNTSFRENLCYGLRRTINEAELNQVIDRSCLRDVLEKLPEGLDSRLGDRGLKLSGGEKQRVSIARAMLKQADILLLDEATSALDTETERTIQMAIDQLVKGCTVLVIAHRLSTVLHANKIVVMEKGRVVEQGKVEELLRQKGRFHYYYTLQSFDGLKKTG